MKRKILILASISVLLVLIAIAFYPKADKKTETVKKESNESVTTTSKNVVYVENEKSEENKEVENKASSKEVTKKEETTKTSTSNKTTTKVKIENKTTITTTSQKKETTTIQTTIATTTTKSCVSKKFNSSWFRADFKTEKECRNKGEQYKGSYGYFCDSLPDECGEIWYMLSLYDSNGEYDWHNIK